MPCNRAGCGGTIVDGYCDTCGRAPAAAKPAVTPVIVAPGGVSARASQVMGTRSGVARGTNTQNAHSAKATGTTGTGRGTGTTGTTGSGRTGSVGSRRGSRGTTRRSLGAGLITLEPLPTLDPLLSIMTDPVVPENKRFCPNCNAKLSLVKGFCPMCGTEYSFAPTLKPGDTVAGQYEVKGAIAFGGLGWIYLGWDNALSRWVVLKGLLNSKDPVSAQAAVAERQFLAAVKHPNIVGVYNFVSQGNEGYIVMEYVGGKTLKTIRKERGTPLPPAEAMAYIHRVLLAFGYLEKQGLVYCDFKPDNIMLEDDDIKLIDMGGVRRVDDMDGDVYGTKGYSAPEGGTDPSFTSDLYTVARTLAVLVCDFSIQSSKYEFALPTPDEQPVFAQNDSLYRLLLKATHKEPDLRFQDADEMAAQLLGVLRETVSLIGTPRAIESTHFGSDNAEAVENPDALDFRVLPAPKPDAADPAVGVILSAASLTDSDQVAALFEKAMAQYPESVEAPLLLARARIGQGRFEDAEALLKTAEANDPFDWEVPWVRALSAFAQRDYATARRLFDHVYGEISGELAPKLAIAFAAEGEGDFATATHFYDLVGRVDPSYTSAAFGLARCRAKEKDRPGSVAAYTRVAQTSRRYTLAQMALARALIHHEPTPPGAAELAQASAALQSLSLDGYIAHELSAQLLRAAVAQVEAGKLAKGTDVRVLGEPLDATRLRFALERELRAQARYAKTPTEKIALVDAANHERPRTLV